MTGVVKWMPKCLIRKPQPRNRRRDRVSNSKPNNAPRAGSNLPTGRVLLSRLKVRDWGGPAMNPDCARNGMDAKVLLTIRSAKPFLRSVPEDRGAKGKEYRSRVRRHQSLEGQLEIGRSS